MHHPRLAFNPLARNALSRGFNQLADLLETTLGPRGRLVAVARDNPQRAPELLNDGATIARRFLGFPDRFETMGAFLARHIAWRMEEAVGDGATTAVIIARQILNETAQLVASGHNPMRLRHGLERGVGVVLNELKAQAQPLEHPEAIAALATAVAGDVTVGKYIEEIFDTVGPHGAVEVRTNYARGHERQYIHGAFWNQGWASSYFAADGKTATLQQPFLLLTNRLLSSGAELLPILERVRQAGQRGLVVIANVIERDALNTLVTNHTRGALPTLAIKTPGLGSEKNDILQDLAVLCGGIAFLQENGRRLEDASLTDLGQAEEVQAIRSGFTLIGGKGRPAAIRQRSQELCNKLATAAPGRERQRLQERAGKLMGGVALLKVGAATESELELLKERAREAVQVVRLGLQDGIAVGGGMAFLNTLPALAQLDLPAEEAPAIGVLRSALQAPLVALLRNAGYAAPPILARLSTSQADCGFDVQQGQIVNLLANHIIDPVQVLQAALRIGVSGALMALTTDVLVYRPRHNRSKEVDFKP
jgi:chaperonin GroEL